jgi:hypothetical protein
MGANSVTDILFYLHGLTGQVTEVTKVTAFLDKRECERPAKAVLFPLHLVSGAWRILRGHWLQNPACRVGPFNRRRFEERKISIPAPGPGRKIFAFFALFQCILKGHVGRQLIEMV